MNYCFRLLLLLIILPAELTIAQEKEAIKVNWSAENRLKITDFKAMAPNHSIERKLKNGRKHSTLEGYIFSGVDFVMEQKGKALRFNAQAFMEPGQSWLRDTNSISTLQHEQAHFDLTEIYARKMRKELSKVKSANEGKNIYRKYFKLLVKEQADFDEDQFGEDGVTKEWQEKIERELSKLNEFKESLVIVDLH